MDKSKTIRAPLLASAAWAEVCTAIRRGQKPSAWSHPLTESVLIEMGGFSSLSSQESRELNFKGNDFKAIFKLRAMSAEQAGRAA